MHPKRIPTAFRDDDLKAFLEANPLKEVCEIAEDLGVRMTAVAEGLKRFGKVKKAPKGGAPRPK